MQLHLVHLILVSGWFGLVLAEYVIELTLEEAAATIAHYWIDLLIELPLLLSILLTGALLTERYATNDLLHVLKIGCGLLAVISALTCIAFVIVRKRRSCEGFETGKLSLYIRLTGAATPAGLLAAYIGLAHFNRL